ncbi:hypothetical protein KIH27_16110 [Mycobacterium sp. M1]|uniref:Transmembrane protein n=1 Tax=Mycolicibacter acidiphilus TaxID=2835306 RepID=A0ABS5RLC7_9MYCO|nr:hypothetical protein [Mycolicibacter acidiphilus]MBS9535113.1 hypothetical protein [Mycolicibacter acidiphilus]
MMRVRFIGFFLVAFLTVASLLAWWAILGMMWKDCETLPDNVANGATIIVSAPVVLVGVAAATSATYALLVRLPKSWSMYVAIGASVIIAALAVIVAVSWVYQPVAHSENPSCHKGAPSWWWFPT